MVSHLKVHYTLLLQYGASVEPQNTERLMRSTLMLCQSFESYKEMASNQLFQTIPQRVAASPLLHMLCMC